MKSRTSRNTIAMMFVIMIIGFLMNIQVLFPFKNEHFIQRGWVKGITVYEPHGKSFTLSLSQQGELLRLLNESPLVKDIDTGCLPHAASDSELEKIVIHRFAKDDIELLRACDCNGKTLLTIVGTEDAESLLETSQTKLFDILSASRR